MMCARGSTSHRIKKTMSSPICVARTLSRLRRSRRSHSRYCGLWATAGSAFDMDFELLPERVEVLIELGRVARGERRRPAAVRARELDAVIRFHPAGPPRQHDDALRHADRFPD